MQQNARAAGGSFEIDSKPGEGTHLKATFGLSHLDRPPLGDIAETMYLLFLSYSEGELRYRHQTESGTFSISTSELREALGEVSFQQKEVREGIMELINTNLEEIGATK